MVFHDFGIITDDKIEYKDYEPAKYGCVEVDEDALDNIAIQFKDIDTFWHSRLRPNYGLAYWGITLIPPRSLGAFKAIFEATENLAFAEVVTVINNAIAQNKWVIHFGV
jgi:hypothetical protein